MYTKEESKQVKQLFWTSFGKSFPKKWLLYNTKVKGLRFKFHFDNKKALVALDIDGKLENRIKYWHKLQALQTILTTDFLPDAIFDDTYFLENGKEISRIYVVLDKKVNIHNKNNWQDVMLFFNKNMTIFERFFHDYKEVIVN